MTAYDIKTGKKVWRGYSMGRFRYTNRSGKHNQSRQAGRSDSGTNNLEGDQWKIGGGATWGWISSTPN